MLRRNLAAVLVALVGAAVANDALAASAASASSAKGRLPALRVIPKLAAGKGTSVTIGSRGGRLHVKTPRGMLVTLVVPAGALGHDTKVTLTPLSGLKRVPFRRGIVGAVQLLPEGLVLARPARLELRPRKPVPNRLQTPFSATGHGSSFHVYPGKAGRLMTLPVVHFTIYGEGEASKQERLGEASRQQSSPQAAVERDLAEQGSDARVASDLTPLAERVASEVASALGDDTLVSRAIDDALTLAEELRLAGWSSDVLPDMGDRIPASSTRLRQLIQEIETSFPNQLLENALSRALDRCAAAHSQASRDGALSIMETERLLGVTDTIDTSLLDRCYSYALEVTSNRSGSSDTTGGPPLNEHLTASYRYGLHSLVPFTLSSGGDGSLVWTAFSDHTEQYFPNGSGQCIGTGPETDTSDGQDPLPGGVTVQQLTLDPDISLTVSIAPASYNTHFVDSNSCGSSSTDDQRTSDDGGFQGASYSAGVSSTVQNGYTITGWTPGSTGSSVVATKTITLTDGTIALKITRAG